MTPYAFQVLIETRMVILDDSATPCYPENLLFMKSTPIDTVLVLGGGRQKTDDRIDYAVGTSGLAKVGDKIEKDQPLVVLHASSQEKLAQAMPYIEKAFTLVDAPVEAPKPIVDRITG